MIERYSVKEIADIWTDKNKLKLWQEVELAVLCASAELGVISFDIFDQIKAALAAAPIDIEWWKDRDNEIKHDLNAFIDERLRHLPQQLHQYFHRGLTSYDTEELPFQLRLIESTEIILSRAQELIKVLKELAQKYRTTPMIGRTHGQEAKLQSFGKRVLTWLIRIQNDLQAIKAATENLHYSKLSGAIGNYQGISPEVEAKALSYFLFRPYYGATQIMPRELHARLAETLGCLSASVNQIALDIRLGARSGLPIYQEPFGKKQKGSSAMPHKKNTISTEQLAGMTILADGYCQMIQRCINTWEERAIEQSCVERIAWPDLFHVLAHSLKTICNITAKLTVFEKNMAQEITNSCGLYASEEVKEFIKDIGAQYGLGYEESYRLTQLAAFNAFEGQTRSLKEILLHGILEVSPNLDAKVEDVKKWNDILDKIFRDPKNKAELEKYFEVAYHLRGEEILFQKILGQ